MDNLEEFKSIVKSLEEKELNEIYKSKNYDELLDSFTNVLLSKNK